MTEYDNNNSGIAGKPWPEQNFILQGKLNIMGEDNQVAIITAQSRDGNKRLEIYQKIGVLFENKNKENNPKQPDYSGPLDGLHQDWRIAGWRGEKNDNKYMSLKVSEVQPNESKTEPEPEPQETSTQKLDDDIPF